MSTSGSFSTNAFTASNGGTRTLAFDWKRDGYSVENNNTTISYNLKGAGSYTGWVNVRNIKLTIDGTVVYNVAGPIKVYQGTVLKSGKITIPHNSLGEKNLKASLECDIYYSNGDQTGSGTWTLDTIPRASTITATDGYIGSKTAITIKSASKDFRHKLTWAITGLSGKITPNTTDKTTYEFEIPTSIYDKIPKDKKAVVTVTCETLYNNNPIGNPTTCKFNALVDEKLCKPTITFDSILDIDPKTANIKADPELVITNLSDMRVANLTAKGVNGAYITSLISKCGNEVKTKTEDFEGIEQDFVDAKSGTFTFIATDSRGISTEVIYNAETIEYTIPKITVEAKRKSHTSDDVRVEYSGSWFGQFKNSLSVDYRYRQGDGNYSGWCNIIKRDKDKNNTFTEGSADIDNLVFQGIVEALINKFDYTKTHTLQFRVKDDFYERQILGVTIPRGIPVFDWGEDDFNFNVPVTFQAAVNFSQPATVDDEEPTADFVVEQGTKTVTDPSVTNGTVTWTYRKWNSGIAECWATRQVSGLKVGSAWGSWYSSTPEMNAINYPFTFTSRPTETVTIGSDNMSCLLCVVSINTTTKSGKYSAMRPVAADTTTYSIWTQYHAIGRWK